VIARARVCAGILAVSLAGGLAAQLGYFLRLHELLAAR
jgi:hypothetical protein